MKRDRSLPPVLRGEIRAIESRLRGNMIVDQDRRQKAVNRLAQLKAIAREFRRGQRKTAAST